MINTKALQFFEFKLSSNTSVSQETTSSTTSATSTTFKTWKTEDSKRRLVSSLKMSEEFKDPAIKLFGKTISLPHNDGFSEDFDDQGSQTSSNAAVYRDIKNTSGDEGFAPCENEVETSDPTEEIEDEDGEESEEKTLKKPDKILPCPRCNSMDTKFCYYNNYNVNQPRHFCKNCQRYWTAGGTMRNVPVGSGRRKNKSACSSQYRHMMGTSDHCLKPNGTVLNFGPENPLCESMSSVLDLAERSSSNSNSNSTEPDSRNYQGFIPVQHAPPPQWPYQFPTAFYPAPTYWGCVAPAPWNMPWMQQPHSQQPQQFSDQSGSFRSSDHDSPTLGKHGRDGGNIQNNSERTILVPKTLRIDDPKEAAKSSIWSTLGIKNECIHGGERLFKAAFPAGKGKGNSKMDVDETCLVMQANPAAFSRSQCFHEST